MHRRSRTRHVVGAVALVVAGALASTGCLVVEGPTVLLAGAWAYDVNESGVVVGSRWLISPTVSIQDHAYRYEPGTGTITSLGSIGGEASSALAVNDGGAIVGWANPASGSRRAFLYESGTGMISLGVLAPSATSPTSVATDINDAGVIVGESNLETGTTDATHAFVREPGNPTLIDLGTLGGASSSATGVNEAGLVVGWSEVAGGARHAFVFDLATDVMTDLGTFGGVGAEATAINDVGQIVGSVDTGTDWEPDLCGTSCPVQVPFVYDVGTAQVTMLETPRGFTTSVPRSINDDGVAVGTATKLGVVCSHCSFPTQATAWEVGTLGVYAIGGALHTASGINDAGTVVGTWLDVPAPFVRIPTAYQAQVTHVAES